MSKRILFHPLYRIHRHTLVLRPSRAPEWRGFRGLGELLANQVLERVGPAGAQVRGPPGPRRPSGSSTPDALGGAVRGSQALVPEEAPGA